jgi:hypothetical protein
MENIHLYQIAYSEETFSAVPPAYGVLDNRSSLHNDWREYWPIRNFLLKNKLKKNHYFGFFSPRFEEKTALTHAQVTAFVQQAGPKADLVSFSPQPDMGAFFLNVFEQEELFQPGFINASTAFLAQAGISVDLKTLVMDSRQVIFSNYFVAKTSFWLEWLALNEQIFAVCEGPDSDLKAQLIHATSYPGAVQRKVFLVERMASLLLSINPAWKVCAYNTFDCAWSASRLAQFKFQAVLSDALKIAIKEQGFSQYREAFSQVRDQLR